MDSIPDILADLRAGKCIVLVDDEARENEGDLVCAAELVTPAVINFMLREGRGMLCVPLSGEICGRLDLPPQASVNTTQRGTAFTVTVDAHERFGITTGVSTAERAGTIRRLIADDATAADFARPGHVQPLRARDGGVLVRAGQTEGSIDLCLLAGLRPGAVIIEVMNDDGTMARRPDLERLCGKHGLKMCSVADVIHHRLERQKLVRRLATAPLDTEFGRFTVIGYESVVDPLPHVALVCGGVGDLDAAGQVAEIDEPVLVRMHSQNILGDVFLDLGQPSGRTLRAALRQIQRAGRGALVYLRHEKMGSGILRELQTVRLPGEEGRRSERLMMGRSHLTPGIRPPEDKRDYGIGSQILRDLGIRRMRLLTNHPFHPTALAGFGLSISEFVGVEEGE